MIISSTEVLRFSELELLTSETAKILRRLVAERDELEKRLIASAKAGQKVEAICPFRLQVNVEDKRYSPKYKECAIDFAGEKAVTDWVIAHDPHDTKDVLALIPKKENPKLSKETSVALAGLKATTARAA